MAGAKSFRELKVYMAAREAARCVFAVTKSFPREERYALTNQIRRSSRAVKAMLAEAWARRRYKAAFINKIDEALGEANETQSWLDDAIDGEYVSKQDFQELDNRNQAISGMLARMIIAQTILVNAHRRRIIGAYLAGLKKNHHSPITDH